MGRSNLQMHWCLTMAKTIGYIAQWLVQIRVCPSCKQPVLRCATCARRLALGSGRRVAFPFAPRATSPLSTRHRPRAHDRKHVCAGARRSPFVGRRRGAKSKPPNGCKTCALRTSHALLCSRDGSDCRAVLGPRQAPENASRCRAGT